MAAVLCVVLMCTAATKSDCRPVLITNCNYSPFKTETIQSCQVNTFFSQNCVQVDNVVFDYLFLQDVSNASHLAAVDVWYKLRFSSSRQVCPVMRMQMYFCNTEKQKKTAVFYKSVPLIYL